MSDVMICHNFLEGNHGELENPQAPGPKRVADATNAHLSWERGGNRNGQEIVAPDNPNNPGGLLRGSTLQTQL